MKTSYQSAFTLVEVMIAVAIVAILAAVAVPSYLSYVRKAGRNEAAAGLTALQQAQERWRARNPTYTETIGTGGLGFTSTVTAPGGYYNLAITSGTATGTGYTATVTAVTGSRQASDSGCTTITLTVVNGTATPSPANCWSR